MKALIRKRDKSKHVAPPPTPPAGPPTIQLSGLSSEPYVPSIAPGFALGASPSVTSFSSMTSGGGGHSGSPPPLYARFARASSGVDFNDSSSTSLTPPMSPPHTLRHKASTDSSHKGGSGFRSSGVRDEVERLAVTKRDREGSVGPGGQRKPKSVRSASSSGEV